MTLAPDEEYCASCGEPVKKAAEWCPNCGVGTASTPTAAQQTHQYCESCGKQINVNAEICPGCGVPQRSTTASSPDSPESQPANQEWEASSSDVWYYVQWIIGVLFIVSALAGLGDAPEEGVFQTLVLAGLLFFGGLSLIPEVRNNVEKQHSITTTGTVRNVHTEEVRNPMELCSKCYGDIEAGVRKEFGSEFVVAGLTLTRSVDGENYYCRECRKYEEGAIDTDGVDGPSESLS